jgi:BASS family bile acid:Na+ symporter
VLALATSARHPAIAMTIGNLNFPDQKPVILVIVLLHVIVGFVLGIPYLVWRERVRASRAITTPPQP